MREFFLVIGEGVMGDGDEFGVNKITRLMAISFYMIPLIFFSIPKNNSSSVGFFNAHVNPVSYQLKILTSTI